MGRDRHLNSPARIGAVGLAIGRTIGQNRAARQQCKLLRVPTIAEEDAKRPNRERECLVKDRTRLVNRMKGTLGPARHS